jgi:hypothetical protein
MIQCVYCTKQSDAKRLPPGWHRDPADSPVCSSCWNERYLLRAVTIPVAGPVDGTWEELRESLRTAWQAATRLSNWAIRELAKADIVRTPEMKKLPRMAAVYLYPGAREVWLPVDGDVNRKGLAANEDLMQGGR